MAFKPSLFSGSRFIKFGIGFEEREQFRKSTCEDPPGHSLSHDDDDLILRLPEEIMLNIISRLPVDSVLECRMVFKTWRNLLPLLPRGGINTNHLADMHLRRLLQQQHHHANNSDSETDHKLSFVSVGGSSLYYVEYDENDVQSCCKLKRFKLPIPADAMSLVGSCNGLISLAVHIRCCFDPIYICNPITREFVHLPRFIMNDDITFYDIAHGFGYVPSTNEYKVVRVCYFTAVRPCIGQVYVYTLGSDIGWRNKGEVNLALEPTELRSLAVFLNGAKIGFPFLSSCSIVCMLGGWLCVVRKETEYNITNIEIWLFKKNEKHSDDDMEEAEEHEYQFWSWTREFTMKMNNMYRRIHPLSITKGGEIFIIVQLEDYSML